MTRRKLSMAIALFGVVVTSLGVTVIPAAAELRTLTVTLLGGKTVTVTVDVPPCTPLDEITIPGIDVPITGISGSVPCPEVPGATTPAPTSPPPSSTPTPDATEAPPAEGSDEPTPARGKDKGARQKTSGRRGADEPESGDTADLISIVEDEDPARKRKGDRGRNSDGRPTLDNPTFSLATPGPAPIGVPNFFIEKFRIPPFLLPIYQAAGIEYGVRWEVLAAINEIETDYGRNLNVSTAGAVGWMQFLPSTWKSYGVDANKDGLKDPYNPVDAIFAAARYLRAAGADKDLGRAIFAYNHADWYVSSVLLRARLIGGLPSNLVGSLTGLTQGHFPVHAKATYADDLSEKEMRKRTKKGQNAAYLVQSKGNRRGINVYARRGAPVIAVNDGKIVRVGRTERLGRFVQLQDVYGNTYTYAHLGKVAKLYPSPKKRNVTKEQIARELELPRADRKPSAPASAGTEKPSAKAPSRKVRAKLPKASETVKEQAASVTKERLFADPTRPGNEKAGGAQQLLETGGKLRGYVVFTANSPIFGLDAKDVELKRLRKGARISAGTILGRIGKTAPRVAPHLLFEIRPAGRGAPRIDPKPILDGWKLLESTELYRAAGKNPFFGRDAATPSIGQVLLMSKEALVRRVLSNPRIEIYDCGRNDIQGGIVDRRVLATLEFLAASGFKPTVTSLRCGHGFYTASGNVSHHSSGNAVDIAKINGIPVLGHQGRGSITELAVQRLLTLQGTLKPDQVITLMKFEGADNTYAMGDHADHIHVGWRPLYGTNSKTAKQVNAILKPNQWIKLIDRLKEVDNPTVREAPSKYALKVVKRASKAHRGE